MAAAISWSGTFHAIGARLLREYAERIGLDRAFTIHDREDSADLLNLIRHDLGYSTTEKRFPGKKHLPCHLLARGQRREPPRRRARQPFPLVRRLGGGAARAVCGLCRGQAAPACARLRRSVALLGADDGRAGDRSRRLRALRSRPGRRISGHQPAAGRDPAGAQAERQGPHRGRRRCAIDLLVPRRDRAQHPRLSRPVQPARGSRSRSSTITARRSRSSPPPTP